jgi:hypothetical protein
MLAATLMAGAAAWAEPLPSDRDRQPRSETEGQAPSSQDLSERLDRQRGVIRPPQSVDPGMQVSPPDPDTRMPVVPPPGSPGGDPTIEPK